MKRQHDTSETPASAIQQAALYHRPNQEFRYATVDGRVTIRLKAAAGNIARAEVCYGNRYDTKRLPSCHVLAMERQLCDGISDWFEVSFLPDDPRLFYYFRLSGQGSRPEILYLQESGVFIEPTLENRCEFFNFPYIQEGDIHKLPEWLRGSVLYQIFPDRFQRAAAPGQNRTPEGKTLKRWGTIPKGHELYGGTLKGIQAQIPYIASLGVDTVYLTPVFRSKSAHRYDTDDYFEIDPLLGTKQDLRDLAEALHHAGLHLILDAVFNHSSPDFFAFRDVLAHGEASRYRDWFHIEAFPVDMKQRNYKTFASVPTMPKLNAANPELADYLCEVGRFWIREAGIDGWRIDVANEVDPNFWRKFRAAVKAENPEAAIIGEIWGDSHLWLGGDMFDSVMHYPFTFPVKDFFARGTMSLPELDRRLNRIAAMYTHPVRDALWTMLDTHDTERFFTATGENAESTRLAAFLQFAFPGSPLVYYGAEIGMKGAHDPDCRRCMEWERTSGDNEFLAFYRRLGSARRELPALRTGSFRTLMATDSVYAFLRMTPDNAVIAVMNVSDAEQLVSIDLPAACPDLGTWRDYLEGAEVLHQQPTRVTVRIAGRSGALLYGVV